MPQATKARLSNNPQVANSTNRRGPLENQFDDSSVSIWSIAECIGISRRCRILVWIGRIFRSRWRRMAHGIAQHVALPCVALTLRCPTFQRLGTSKSTPA
ncbi:hypothetical protein ACFFYR_23735, partial [Paraburkholderia dipogonis]|uniref:hypothetical protein n=1 Tax=Paraburkholderia dipogonis TaxID=1211383 RepID=UPI0035EED4C3